jgi:hypothetical protein
MSKKAIIVQVDVSCDTQGPAPSYRAWLEDELFTERTWRFEAHQYLEETWQINARPGRYQLRYELIGNGRLTVSNWQVLKGCAGINKHGQLVIHDA